MNPDHRLTKLDEESGLPRLKEKSELHFAPNADVSDMDPVFRLFDYENSGLYPSEVRRLKENDTIERKLLLDNGFLSVDDLVAAYLRAKSELDAANGVTIDPKDPEKFIKAAIQDGATVFSPEDFSDMAKALGQQP